MTYTNDMSFESVVAYGNIAQAMPHGVLAVLLSMHQVAQVDCMLSDILRSAKSVFTHCRVVFDCQRSAGIGSSFTGNA